MNDNKPVKAFELLSVALKASDESPKDALVQAALAKAFESSFEYAWKYFKREADDAGLEVYSPRDAIKAAAQLKIIESPELWSELMNARNLSVHDYVGMDDQDMRDVVKRFHAEIAQWLRG